MSEHEINTYRDLAANAGKCGELVTVEHQYWHDQTQEWLPTGFPDRYRKDGFLVRELVTRSQAEELLAAERAAQQRLLDIIEEANKDKEALEAHNAAQAARIKELDRCHEGTIDLCNQKTAQIEALEAKLAAADKALERAEFGFDQIHQSLMSNGPKQASGEVTAFFLAETRAVLGGKPS